MNALSAQVAARAIPFDPDQHSFEAFGLSSRTRLHDPLQARSLDHALAEVTHRWSWDRGDRLAVRELAADRDLLHVYAVRRRSEGTKAWQGYVPVTEYTRWLEHIATIDLNVVAGIGVGLLGAEVDLHARAQAERPDNARFSRKGLFDD